MPDRQAVFAEELNEANERASFFQARVAQLEAEVAAGVAGGTATEAAGSRSSNVKAMVSSAAGWVALGNRWSISGADHEKRKTPKKKSAQTPGGYAARPLGVWRARCCSSASAHRRQCFFFD